MENQGVGWGTGFEPRQLESESRVLPLDDPPTKGAFIDLGPARIKGLESAINQQMQVVAGGSKSLSDAAVQYQRLQLDRDFADKQLASSLIALQSAREEAGRQRVYVERIPQPGLPDAAVEPRRLRGIFATLLLSLIAYGIVQMLLVGMREHQL